MSPRRPRRGAVIVLAAVLLVALLCVVAFAVDFGYIVMVKTQLQNAADAGALAGAGSLRDGSAEAKNSAETFAEMHPVANLNVDVKPTQDIELGRWDHRAFAFSSAEEEVDAVRVTCRHSARLFFAKVFGKTSADLSASAVARVKPRCAQIVGLDRVSMSGESYTDSYLSDAGPYGESDIRDNGDVCSNGHIVMSGYAEINGDAHPGPEMVVVGGTVSGNTENLEKTISLPPIDFGDSATNNDNDLIGLSDDGQIVVDPATDTFLLMSGDSINIPPGTHYFNSMILYGGATVTITDSTVIFVNGVCALSGGSVINQNQRPGELQLYCAGTACSISGNAEFHGVVYAPNASVSRSGNTDFYGMIVGKDLTMSGTGGIHADESIGVLWGTTNRPLLVQ